MRRFMGLCSFLLVFAACGDDGDTITQITNVDVHPPGDGGGGNGRGLEVSPSGSQTVTATCLASGPMGSVTFTATFNGQPVSVTTAVSGGSMSPTLVFTAPPGTYLVTFTYQSHTTVVAVRVNSPAVLCGDGGVPTQADSVTLVPPTWNTVVGGQIGWQAAVWPLSLPQTVTWSVNDPSCLLVSATANTAVGTARKACTNVVVTASAGGKSDTSVGTIREGTITCSFTVNVPLAADGSIPMTVGQTVALGTGQCTNEMGAVFPSHWRTGRNDIVNLAGTQTRKVGEKTYFTGPTATIKAIARGNDTVILQTSFTDATVIFSRAAQVR